MKNELLYPWDINKFILNKNKYLNKIKFKKNNIITIKTFGGYTNNDLFDWVKIFSSNYNLKVNFINSEWGRSHELVNQKINYNKFDIMLIMSNFFDLEKDINKISKSLIKNIISNIFIKWEEANNNSKIVFQTLIENSPSNYYDLHIESINEKINYINSHIALKAKKFSNVKIIPTNNISNQIGLNNYFDIRNWHSFGQYKTYAGLINVAHSISSSVSSIYGRSKKLIILDLDNTLWGGVFADDGIGEISLGPDTNDGRAYYEFQKYILKLKKQGILLSICSKNNYDNIRGVFSHPYMLLKEKDFISVIINWEDKYVNIKKIFKELNLTEESCIFIDDNKIEREEVKQYLPNVAVPEINDDPSKFIEIIHNNKFFTTFSENTNEDKIRNKSYNQNINRNNYKKKFENKDIFLKSLNTKINIKKLDNFSLDRSVQLINKTNQFNLNSTMVEKNQFLKFAKQNNSFIFTADVKDKFGEYGIISIIYGNINNSDKSIIILNWVMSCRIFNRKIENSIFIYINNYFKAKGIKKIKSTFIQTKHNNYIINLHSTLKFNKINTKHPREFWEYNIGSKKLEDNINKLTV